MQSVVTGQAPTYNSGVEGYLRRKNKEKQKIIRTITETNRNPQSRIKGKISVRTYQIHIIR